MSYSLFSTHYPVSGCDLDGFIVGSDNNNMVVFGLGQKDERIHLHIWPINDQQESPLPRQGQECHSLANHNFGLPHRSSRNCTRS